MNEQMNEQDPQSISINEQQIAFNEGKVRGQNDVDTATISGLDDVKLAQLIRDYIQKSGTNVSVADVMESISTDDFKKLMGQSLDKVLKLKEISKTVGKVLGALTREKNGEQPLLVRLKNLTKMDRERILKELKDIPEEKFAEVVTVAKSFAQVVLSQQNQRSIAEYAPMYLKFLNGLFRNKDYLNFSAPGTGVASMTSLEADLVLFSTRDTDVIKSVFVPTFVSAYEALNHNSSSARPLAGAQNIVKIGERLYELIPSLSVNPPSSESQTATSISSMIALNKQKAEGGFNIDLQRVSKLRSDMAQSLLTEVSGLIDLEGGQYITIGGENYDTRAIDQMLSNFSPNKKSEWFKTSNLLQRYMAELEENRNSQRRGSYPEKKIAKLRSIITSRNALDLLNNSSDIINGFIPMYERHFEYEIASELGLPQADKTQFESLTDKQKGAVAERTATRFREAVLFTVSNIYRSYLSSGEEPKEEFRPTLQHAGDAYINPAEMFKQFTNMLSNLVTQAKQVNKTHDIDFTVLAYGDMHTMYIPELRKDVTTFNSHRQQKGGASVYDFMKELLTTVKTDDGFFEAGHQFRFISNMGSPDQTKSFFGSLGEFLKYSMSAENIDRIYSMENAGDIVRVASIIEAQLEKRMADKGWLNEGEGKMFEEIFLNKGDGGSTLVNYILKYLKDYQPGIPEWQRQRVMQHAFTIVFAGRFRFQQIYSYANPTRGFQGQAEDKQMFNSVFSPFQKLLRFPPQASHDFALKRALWNPRNNMPGYNYEGSWDAEKMGDEGFKVFDSGQHQKLGRLAWDMTKWFHDDVPYAMGPVNELKVGGYDTLRGWRRYANMGVIDKRLYEHKSQGGMPSFRPAYEENGAKKIDGITRLWKSLENVGQNELLAFSDGDIEKFFAVKDGVMSNNAPIEHFVRHLYKRYFSPDNPIGKMFPHNFLLEKVRRPKDESGDKFPDEPVYFATEEEFMTQFYTRISDIIRDSKNRRKPDKESDKDASGEIQKSLVKPMLQSALLCIVAERSPTSLMNRVKPWDEQNGYTLNSEIRDGYWRDGSSFMQNLAELGSIDDSVSRDLSSNDDQKKALLKKSFWDSTENDLIDSQSELRAEIDQEILANRASWQDATGGANIYGESFDQERSSVNGGKGYVLDEDTLIRLMIKKEQPELAGRLKRGDLSPDAALETLKNSDNNSLKALALRIERVVALRADIVTKLAEVPAISEDERKLEKELLDSSGERVKDGLDEDTAFRANRLLINKQKRITRIRWFQKMLNERFLGSIPFMIDNSEIHKTFLNADNTLVSRSTGECGIAEQYKGILDPRSPEGPLTNMLEKMKDAARKGTPAEWAKLKSIITGFRKNCGDEIGDPEVYMPIVKGLVKLQLTGFTNKQEVRNALGKWKMMFDKKGQSLFSSSYTWFEHHGFDAITVREYLMTFTKVNAINPEDMDEFCEMFQSTWWGVAKEVIPEYLTYIISFMLVSYVTEAIKKESPSSSK